MTLLIPFEFDTGVTLTLRSRREALKLAWVSITKDWVIVLGLLGIVGYVSARGMTLNPSLFTTDDEGTYVAQAWAILNRGELAHYTYWYDHPPLGWIQLAGWAWITDGFHRLDSAIALGREFMLVVKLAAVVIIYALSRRLGMNKFFAAGCVCLYGLSPLGVYFQRLTFLDNITLPWLLAAFFLAATPNNRLSAHIGAALCFAVAVLTKETVAPIGVALVYQLYHGTHPRTRKMSFFITAPIFTLTAFFYILMAIIKGELLPGPGHVDLMYAIKWQLLSRAPSGNILQNGTAAHSIASSWARLDPWLVGSGIALMIPAFLSRTLRPVALALVIEVAIMLRPGGYLPQPYVVAMIPFAALVVAGCGNAVWSSGTLNWFHRMRHQVPGLRYSYAQVFVKLLASGMVGAFIVVVAIPQWSPRLHDLTHDDLNTSMRQTMAWVKANVPTNKGLDGTPVRIIVGDAMWVDLEQLGYDPDWYFKVDLDPAVKIKYPDGWRDADYVIFTNEMNEIAKSSSKSDMTTTLDARTHSLLVATFGVSSERVWIYKVKNEPGS